MRVLVLHAHPVDESFSRSLYRTVVDTLTAKGHQVDGLNLYAEKFDAVLSREERLRYEEVPENQASVQPYVDRLLAAQALVIVHPVWNYGYPAILKGYFDRVFLPGISFLLVDGKVKPAFKHIRKVAFVTTYGGDRLRTMIMGDPPRRLARRWAWLTFGGWLPPKYLALYDMNNNREPELKQFIARVKAAMENF